MTLSNQESKEKRPIQVVAIAHFPPPMSGNAKISKDVCDSLERRAASLDGVRFVARNMSKNNDSSNLKFLFKLRNYFKAIFLLVLKKRKFERKLYIVCEGRGGVPLTLLTVIFSRIAKYKIYLHHHSYGYISEPTLSMRLINLCVGSQARHVFLSNGMAKAFFAAYRPERNQIIAHNLAHISSFWRAARKTPRRPRSKTVRVGCLSNLSFEKGLDTFIAIAEAGIQSEERFQFYLAGPVESPKEIEFLDLAKRRLGDRLHYVGGVYGQDKVQFLRDVDIFVFPTRYYHEAQPIVLHEALSAGCAVISTDRGCIAEDLHAMGGFVVPRERSQDPQAYLGIIQSLLADRNELARVRARSLRLTRQRAKEAVEATNRWLNEMVHEAT